MAKYILVTGGAGYIGSHTALQLLLSGWHVAAVDSLDNSSEVAISRVSRLAGDFGKHLSFHKLDLRDKHALEEVFSSRKFDAVIHFAGSKAVGESVAKPLLYYNNNVTGTVVLLEVMAAYGCKKKIPVVYGERRPGDCQVLYAAKTKAETQLKWKAKFGIEEMCRDQWNWACNNPYGYMGREEKKDESNGGIETCFGPICTKK